MAEVSRSCKQWLRSPMKKKVLSLALGSATLFLGAAHARDEKMAPAAPPAALDANQAELLRRYDTNHDGKLDEAELASAHEKMLKEGAGGGGRRGRVRAELLKRFDKNGDGELDQAERADMRKYFLTRFDKNGDGRLDEEERAAMREEFKAQAKALKLKK